MCVTKQLAQGCTRQRGGQDSNPRSVNRKYGPLTLAVVTIAKEMRLHGTAQVCA